MITRGVLLSTLGRVRDAKVAVLGDFCVDAYWHLAQEAAEVSIETGLPVRRVDAQSYSLGGAGNVAANLVALGVREVRAIGVRGADVFGHALEGLLEDAGVDAGGLWNLGPSWQTLVYAKPFRGAMEEQRLDFGARDVLDAEAVAQVLGSLRAACQWADVVVINQQVASCFAQPAFIDALNAVIAETPDVIFVVDARDAAGRFRGAVLKLNEREADAILGESIDATLTSARVSSTARHLMQETGQPVFITRGERGIIAVDASGVHEIRGIEAVTPIDPVGAGDTVVATIAAVLAASGDVVTAAAIANLAASVTVTKMHMTGTATAAELERAVDQVNYIYEPELADNPAQARYLEGTDIELIGAAAPAAHIGHAIFDHDGTLSTLRQGWESVMEPMMVNAILGPAKESVDAAAYARVRTAVISHIDRTTGVQTLVQMVGLVQLVRNFGYVPADEVLDEHGYKAIYNDQLLGLVNSRLAKLQAKRLQQEDFQIKGAISVLTYLRERGVTLYLASGTDVADVRAEAEALGFAGFFDDRIYGAVGDVTIEAKRIVMEQIVGANRLQAGSFVTFGDGPVELRETKRRGGVAVGLCSDETRRYGLNPLKRRRLIRGGADLVVPDFTELDALMPLLNLN